MRRVRGGINPGSLGGVVMFLTWLYITSFVLLMGGELNSELERQQAEDAKAKVALAAEAPPLEGEGLGRGGLSGNAQPVIDATPTLPSPLKGEGVRTAGAVALLAGAGAVFFRRNRKSSSAEVYFSYPKPS